MCYKNFLNRAVNKTHKIILCAISITLLLLYISCSKEDTQKAAGHFTKVIHPTIENSIEKEKLSNVIKAKKEHLETPYSNLREIFSVGVDSGKSYEIFGSITDIDIDKNGNVYILDRQHNKVYVFDKTGNYISGFGRAGRGPGEFMYANNIEISGNSILVSDRYLKVEVFKKNPNKIDFEHSFTMNLDFAPNDFCVIGNRIYLSGVKVNSDKNEIKKHSTIHIYDLETGRYLNSFGQPYKSKNNLTVFQLSSTRLVCSEKKNMVIGMLTYFPYLFGYSATGELKWTSKFDDFYIRKIVEELKNGRPAITIGGRQNVKDYLGAFSTLEDGNITIQISRISTNDDGSKTGKLMTYLINPEDGSGSYLSSKLPSILSSNKEYIVSYKSINSIPTVSLYEY